MKEAEPYVQVSTLAALAGVVKETIEGVWEEAVRISPADAPITIVYHNWVNGVDPIAYYQENGARLAANAKFWQDYWIASQKKYVEQLRLEVKAAQAAAVQAAKVQAQQVQVDTSDYAEWSRLIASTGGRVITDLSTEQYQAFVAQSADAALLK